MFHENKKNPNHLILTLFVEGVCESGLSALDVLGWGGGVSPEEALTQKFSSNRKKLKKKEI